MMYLNNIIQFPSMAKGIRHTNDHAIADNISNVWKPNIAILCSPHQDTPIRSLGCIELIHLENLTTHHVPPHAPSTSKG